MDENLKYFTMWLGLRPTDPGYGLNNSIPVIGSLDTRVCFDPKNSEIVVFMEHDEKKYHGNVRNINRLESDIKQTLLANFKLNSASESYVSFAEDNSELQESFDNVRNAIALKDYDYVKYIMPAIGRDGFYDDDLKSIINLCLQVEDPWIQRAAYLCAYNIIVRYEGFEFDDYLKDIINYGSKNKSAQVVGIISRIKLFCSEFGILL